MYLLVDIHTIGGHNICTLVMIGRVITNRHMRVRIPAGNILAVLHIFMTGHRSWDIVLTARKCLLG